MNSVVVIALIILFTGTNPDNGNAQFEVQSTQEMTAEQCITEANKINNNPDIPFTMVCSPKILGVDIEG